MGQFQGKKFDTVLIQSLAFSVPVQIRFMTGEKLKFKSINEVIKTLKGMIKNRRSNLKQELFPAWTLTDQLSQNESWREEILVLKQELKQVRQWQKTGSVSK